MLDSPGALRVPGDPDLDQNCVIPFVIFWYISGALRAPEMSENTREPNGLGVFGLFQKGPLPSCFWCPFRDQFGALWGNPPEKVKKVFSP